MKPAWDQLIESYKGSPDVLVADVDCTAAGASLCQKVGVRGYPTIKWGDPEELQDYEGGRDYESLESFAKANLGKLREKSPVEKLLHQLQKQLKPLQGDVEHILKFRKNAAALLLVAGGLLGMLVSCICGRCCCGRGSSAKKEKKKAA
eukprot:TRINITY_DN68614_c0_g1_i1.p1 TRINITY_DN68614_c0_g1~~TRINITY_DN68614_c0_g1_i1.p1  ORF type:complete len:148 (-),score=45.22 TRINITY_DN68614_c0_g1_i1:160-603(-)